MTATLLSILWLLFAGYWLYVLWQAVQEDSAIELYHDCMTIPAADPYRCNDDGQRQGLVLANKTLPSELAILFGPLVAGWSAGFLIEWGMRRRRTH